MEGVTEARIKALMSGIGKTIGILYLGFCLDGNGASITVARKMLAADGGSHRSRHKAEVGGIGDKRSIIHCCVWMRMVHQQSSPSASELRPRWAMSYMCNGK
jgi:hypothetical protein